MATKRTAASSVLIIVGSIFVVLILAFLGNFTARAMNHLYYRAKYPSSYTGILHSTVTVTVKQTRHHRLSLYDGDQPITCNDSDCAAFQLQAGQQLVLTKCNKLNPSTVVCYKLVRRKR